MRIVIAGAGDVGSHLVKMFTESNHDVVIIDDNKEKLQEISAHYDVMTIFGSASSKELLEKAEVRKANLFIAVTNSLEVNILSSIIAKKIGTKQTVARIDNSEYLSEENKNMLKNLGVDSLVYPEILASQEIVSQLENPGVLKTITFASGKLYLFTIRVSKKSELIYNTLEEVNILFPHIVARMVAIQRQSDTIIPRGQDVILPDDIMYIITDCKGKKEISNILNVNTVPIKNVMILGGSRIGIKVAKKIEKNFYVKLFEKSREKSFLIADILKDTLVIHSDARSAEFLRDEGVDRTDAFIAVTGNSEVNILSCMLAKKLGVRKTFAEIENTDYFGLTHNTDINYVLNKKLIAASNIFAYVIDAEVLSVKYFTDTQAQTLEFVVHKNSKITKKTLKNLDFPQQAIIGGVVRGKTPFIAIGDSHLQTDDKVVVFCLPGISEKVAKWFK